MWSKVTQDPVLYLVSIWEKERERESDKIITRRRTDNWGDSEGKREERNTEYSIKAVVAHQSMVCYTEATIVLLQELVKLPSEDPNEQFWVMFFLYILQGICSMFL